MFHHGSSLHCTMHQTDRSSSRRQNLFRKTVSVSLLLILAYCGYYLRLPILRIDSRGVSLKTTYDKPVVVDDEQSQGYNGTRPSTLISEKETPPFLPVRVFRRYQQQHSQMALLQDDSDALEHRKFAVAYYWCPHRAGNILHGFLNTVVWAVIHNRTVLWKYDTGAPDTNTEADCQAILKRASWIPSYDEWSVKLHLDEPVAVSMDKHRWAHEHQHTTVIYPQISDLQWNRTDILRHTWSDHPIQRKDYREYIDALPEIVKNTTAKLYYENADFLYGMLYRECFTLVHSGQQDHLDAQDDSSDDLLSLALHSRHTVAADDGSYIDDELECLNRLLLSHRTCRVHLMSDRTRTIELLSDWLQERNCTVVTAARETGVSLSKEHGPWAGKGFLQDLEMAAAARHGAIGDPHRSSFALLVKLIEYDRKIEAWRKGKDLYQDTADKLLQCKLPGRPVSGYDYGSGTPTFRHHSFLKALEPVQVVDDYILQHSYGSDEYASSRRYVVAVLDCELPLMDRVYSVLNSLVYAMLHNRTLLWEAGEACNGQDHVLQVKSWIPRGANISFDNMMQVHLNSKDFVFQRNGTERDAHIIAVRSTHRHSMQTFISTHGSQTTAEKLYAQGIDFLYGMLFHRIFSLNLESKDTPDTWPDPSSISAFVPFENGDDGPSLLHEIQCLQSVLPTIDRPCSVLLLSDRLSTLNGVETWLTSRNCSAIMLTNEPVSERAFFQRIFLASKARSGFIGNHIALSNLLLEWIEYGRRIETWKLGRDPFAIQGLPKCTLAEPGSERSADGISSDNSLI